jgi:SNF2 family DNA or RNA helicase
MQKYYETGHVIAQGVLDQLLRYRQICLAPQLLGLKGNSPKIEWIEQYLKDYPEKKVVIFSKFTSFLHLLQGRIPHVGLVVGETPAKERNDLISSFQHGTLQVLAIQIDAGKEGITLDNADVLIFTDIFPPASDILQAKDRIVATSEERNKPKEIIELMMADSYDEALYDIVAKKIELTDIANNYIKYLQEREW